MRILHTSDWHIGRVWSKVDLLDTQRQFGVWLCDLVKSEKIEAVLVAGDIYDRAVPSAEAVSAADEIFTALAAAGATIVAISGNHDSADRLHFGSRFMVVCTFAPNEQTSPLSANRSLSLPLPEDPLKWCVCRSSNPIAST